LPVQEIITSEVEQQTMDRKNFEVSLEAACLFLVFVKLFSSEIVPDEFQQEV
jgi:hypothetical protein